MITEESIFGGIREAGSCAWKIPKYFPTRRVNRDQAAKIQALRERYDLDPDIDINPNEHHFEFCDPGWWPLLKEKVEEKMGRWPGGLAAFREHGPGRPFVYAANPSATKVALLADFGVGHYHSFLMARQLARLAYPYVFHLGDVYYAGRPDEFAQRYERPFDPVMNVSKLFSLPENHELYDGGNAYLGFLDRELAKGRIEQQGSYFCVRFPKHQIVGLDVNWNGRQRFQHPRVRAWLEGILNEGRGLTTILLTGSAPFAYGERGPSRLHEDLWQWTAVGHINLWFWGDDHYCGLFARDAERANFVGSCIGHGGYPGKVRKAGEVSYMPPTWIETEPRFPRDFGLRDDLTNNGWCSLALQADGGVELVYVDWLGCQRFRARYRRESEPTPHLRLESQTSYERATRFAG